MIRSGSIHKVGGGLGKTAAMDLLPLYIVITLSNGRHYLGGQWTCRLGTLHLHIAMHVVNVSSACTALDLHVVPLARWLPLGPSLRQQ